MAEYVSDTLNYVDYDPQTGALVTVQKRTWTDPDSGATWDTFDTLGPAPDPNMQPGTVVGGADVYANAVNFGDANSFAGAQPQQQTTPQTPPGNQPPLGGEGPTSVSDRTRGTNTPFSSTYANPSPGAATQGSNMSVNRFTPQGNIDPNEVNAQRNLFLYNPEQPTAAFGNMLRGMGFNLGLNNPLTNMLMRFAPGLGAAYQIQNVLGGQQQLPRDIGGDFASFIQRALTGGGGGLAGTLGSARAGVGSALDAIRQQGMNPSLQPNPFIAALQATLESGGGQGLAGALSALQTPFMAPGMAQAFQRALTTGLQGQMFQYGSGNAFADPDAYWLQELYR